MSKCYHMLDLNDKYEWTRLKTNFASVNSRMTCKTKLFCWNFWQIGFYGRLFENNIKKIIFLNAWPFCAYYRYVILILRNSSPGCTDEGKKAIDCKNWYLGVLQQVKIGKNKPKDQLWASSLTLTFDSLTWKWSVFIK